MRVSGLGQQSGDGFKRQAAAIEDYAKANNIDVIRTYQEVVSGAKGEDDRIELGKLLYALEQNGEGIQCVIVERYDRMARDAFVQESILRQLHRYNVKLISAKEGDLDSFQDPDAMAQASRNMCRQIFSIFAEFDRKITVAKLKAARDRKRQSDGRCEGVRPFGTQPGEDAVLKRIAELRKFGYKIPKMVEILNAEAMPTRSRLKLKAKRQSGAKITAKDVAKARPWSYSSLYNIVCRLEGKRRSGMKHEEVK